VIRKNKKESAIAFSNIAMTETVSSGIKARNIIARAENSHAQIGSTYLPSYFFAIFTHLFGLDVYLLLMKLMH
jgi:hypothetical protein